MKLTDILNNRELSLLIWGLIFLGLVLTIKEIRKGLLELLKMLFSKKLLPIHFSLIIYSGIVILFLYKLKLWDSSQIKNSIVWLLFSAFPSLFKAKDVYSQPGYFKKEVKEIFGRTALVEFFVNIVPFSLAIELLLVPILFLTGMLSAFAKTDKKHKPAEKVFEFILFLVGLALVLYAVFQLVFHFKSIATFGNFQDFIIPALFTLFFIPCLYFFSVIMVYESKFITLDFIIQNKKVRKFAKRQALSRFRLNARDLSRWSGFLSRRERATEEDVLESFREFTLMKSLEKNPKAISKEDGWSPYLAKDFLLTEGITTQYYERKIGDEWAASAYSTVVDKEPLANTISYFINGDMVKVTELRLILNVTNPQNKTSANNKLLVCVSALFNKAVGKPIPEKIFNALKNERNTHFLFENLNLELRKDNWPLNPNKAYSMIFTMTIADKLD